MLKEKQFTVLIVLMAILLLTNWLTWSSTREMQDKVNLLQGDLNNLRSQVSSEVSGVRGIVQQIKDDDGWWTAPEVEIQKVDEETANVRLNWLLKEYDENSKVVLNCKKPGMQEFTQVAVDKESNGRFSAVIPVDIPREPVIDIRVEKVGRKSNEKAAISLRESLVNESVKEVLDDRNFNLEYYISVQESDTVRTTEKNFINLSKFRYEVYYPLHLNVRLEDDNQIVASAHRLRIASALHNETDIFLESRNNVGDTVERWPLEPEDIPGEKELNIYRARVIATKNFDSLYAVVKYSDGTQGERKII